MMTVEITNEVPAAEIDAELLRRAVEYVVRAGGVESAQIGMAVVDDETIHGLNRRYLDHDFPTDVITFPLEEQDGHLDGEIVVSLDTARREAGRFGWSVGDELLLYVIHGALHLLGYDDTTADAARQMREQERIMLAHFGRAARYDDPAESTEPAESCSPGLQEAV